MELIYVDEQIVDVKISNSVLQNKLTSQEKLTFFACEYPNATVWKNINWLEVDARNQDDTPKTTLQLTVQSMVSEGLITQQRADELVA